MIPSRSGTVGRYAPSPTGPLHLGNLRTAMLAWLQARLAGGRFILRMEDLDEPRSRDGAAEKIIEDLRWLGLDWDEGPDCGGDTGPYVQSERKNFYAQALAKLLRKKCVYACVCSRKDIQAAASAPHGPDGVIYPGTCRHRIVEKDTRSLDGEVNNGQSAFALRLRVGQSVIAFDDHIRGVQQSQLAQTSGDFVIRRRDGLYAYQLAVAIDDALMGVTDVLRGEDLLESTPRQLLIFDLLDLPRPEYWHVPLMTDQDGRRLAKRNAATSLDHYRSRGLSAGQVLGRLAFSIGLTETDCSVAFVDLLNRIDSVSNFRAMIQDN